MEAKENKKTGWMPIKGFDEYMINKNGEVMSLKRGKLLAVTYGRRIYMYAGGKGYQSTAPRILYAAIHGIDPREIGRVFLIVNRGKRISPKSLHVVRRRDILDIYKKKENFQSLYANSQEEYCIIIKFSTCAKNLDVEGMWKILNGLKPKIMSFIERFVKNEEDKELHFQHLCAYLIDGIIEGRYVVSEPLRYIRRMFRNRIANRSIESLLP